MISSITHIKPLAVPYTPPGRLHAPANGSIVPVDRDPHRFELDSDDGIGPGKQSAVRVAAVKNVNVSADEQRRQQEQKIHSQIFTNDASASRNTPTAQILGEMINRMGGTGIYSGPGQRVNIAV